MSGSCEDCRYWHHLPDNTVTGICERAATFLGEPMFLDANMQAVPIAPGSTARLETWRKFGCVDFEPKGPSAA